MKKSLVCAIVLLTTAAQAAWLPMGRRAFTGRHDSEFVIAPRHDVDALGLDPDAAARCGSIAASFSDGNMDSLSYRRSMIMPPEEITAIALPGGTRNVRSVDLHCHAVNGHRVTITLYARQVSRSG